MKKIISIILLIIVVMGLSGCTGSKKVIDAITKSSTERKENEIIEHMNEKYGKKFVELSIDEADIDCSYDKLECYVEGTDPDTDSCTVYRELNVTNHRHYYRDDYFGIQVREDYEKLINDIVLKYADDCASFADLTGNFHPEVCNKDSTMQDFIDYDEQANVYIAVKCKEKDEEKFKGIVDNVYNELSDKKLKGGFYLFFMNPEGIINIDRTNYSRLLNKSSGYCYYYDTKYLFER